MYAKLYDIVIDEMLIDKAISYKSTGQKEVAYATSFSLNKVLYESSITLYSSSVIELFKYLRSPFFSFYI